MCWLARVDLLISRHIVMRELSTRLTSPVFVWIGVRLEEGGGGGGGGG